MRSKQHRGFQLRFLGVCLFLLALVLVLMPEKFQQVLDPLFRPEKSSGNGSMLATKSDRTADDLRKTKARSPRRDAKEWFAEVRARNPGLEPEWRKVPDDENGFLQWLDFCEALRVDGEIGSENLNLPSDVADMISNPEMWDSQAVKAFLDEHQDLLEAIARIGLLPSQSATDIDVNRWSFVSARFAKQCSELLLADARLAAESGDFDHALRQVRAASGLADHFDQIEVPTLLTATASVLVRLKTQEQVMAHFLPALVGNSGEIARWREAIQSPNMEPSGLSRLLRGEGWMSLGGFLIPAVNGVMSFSSEEGHIPDPDALFDAYAQGYIAIAKRAQMLSLDELVDGVSDHIKFPVTADHLSEGAQSLLEIGAIGVSAWAEGWARSIVLSARTDAALAIMQGEEIPLEPLTGLPYVHDPVARTLQVPDDPRLLEKLRIGDPLQLP